ncbi:hypothetical protein PTTG_26838 [Puccinia triticina 1-1 BBBD Race 1]|uniref:RING-type domain-containing protein n=1 Tax=Puccinia triticina (isolate 1-1 / race 1 (BBBD)) TaxID=630390 RepID=A0A180GPT2_PUCT1|nr:hypothetical protein PTTG_26838 [Puccinia triticina 1-1 BBBD Race 1]WAR52811.1 hypothetical protein PtB15_2B239 [Puccinia triticina]
MKAPEPSTCAPTDITSYSGGALHIEIPIPLKELEEECLICTGNLSSLYKVLPKCKHAFCAECIDTWFKDHYTCPTCRTEDPEAKFAYDAIAAALKEAERNARIEDIRSQLEAQAVALEQHEQELVLQQRQMRNQLIRLVVSLSLTIGVTLFLVISMLRHTRYLNLK